jgi:hypothetical protein
VRQLTAHVPVAVKAVKLQSSCSWCIVGIVIAQAGCRCCRQVADVAGRLQLLQAGCSCCAIHKECRCRCKTRHDSVQTVDMPSHDDANGTARGLIITCMHACGINSEAPCKRVCAACVGSSGCCRRDRIAPSVRREGGCNGCFPMAPTPFAVERRPTAVQGRWPSLARTSRSSASVQARPAPFRALGKHSAAQAGFRLVLRRLVTPPLLVRTNSSLYPHLSMRPGRERPVESFMSTESPPSPCRSTNSRSGSH